MISTGSSLKNAVNTHVVNGSVKIIYDKIILSIADIPNVLITAYKPANTVTCGNIVIDKTKYRNNFFPLNLSFPNANAEKEPMTNAIRVVTPPTMVLFKIERKNVGLLKTDL